MSARDENGHVPPTRQFVADRLRELISGVASREDVAAWAGRWVGMGDPPIEDPRVWRAIERLSGADMISTDRPYLYGREDFERWLSDLLA